MHPVVRLRDNFMVTSLWPHVALTLRWTLRDRILHGVLGLSLLLLLLVPAFSLFSMRQVQEMALALTLSANSFILMILAIFLGSSAVWRDVERRYTSSVLTLPVSRVVYLMGRYAGIALFLAFTGILLAAFSVVIVLFSASRYPSDVAINWLNFAVSVGSDILKYMLLAAIAMLFSCVSTSLFFPMAISLAVYLSGSASQEVFEFVSGRFGEGLTETSLMAIKAVYYLLPNFSSFDYKVHAIYALKLDLNGLMLTLLYFLLYLSLVLTISAVIFKRKELP